jgi:hypothetical protein
MTPQLISIYALVAMFVVATALPINMGVLAFVVLLGTALARRKQAAAGPVTELALDPTSRCD